MTGAVLSRPVTRAWLALVLATLAGWTLAEHAASPRLAATAVMAIAAFKVRLVVAHFMELPWRPRPWRLVLECWTMASTVMIVGGYWAAL